MAKNLVLEWDATASNNTDIGGTGILGTNAVSNFDDAFRTAMAQVASGVVTRFTSRAAGYTAVKSDYGQASFFTAAATLSLTAAATLTAGWQHWVYANAGDVVIDPNGAETINGVATVTVPSGQSALIRCNGTAFYAQIFGAAQSGAGVQGFLAGLTLSNNASDATNDIDIAIGSAAADTSPYAVMSLASALTKRLDAAWAVGSGNGGRMSAAAIADGTYHVWLIQRSDTGVVDAGFDVSATSPTMPTNYDRKRRIGSIIRASGAIVAFIQTGDLFIRSGSIFSQSYAPVGTTGAFFHTAGVPSGIKVIAKLRGTLNNASSIGNSVILISSPDELLSSPVATSGYATAASQVINVYNAFTVDVLTNTSSQVRVISADLTTNIYISTYGWVDSRGRT